MTKQSVTVAPPQPGPSARGGPPTSNVLKHWISGHPSTVEQITKQQQTFHVQHYVLQK